MGSVNSTTSVLNATANTNATLLFNATVNATANITNASFITATVNATVNATANITNATFFDDDGTTTTTSSGGSSSSNLWVLGVVFGLLGSIAINTGNNFQSLGMQQLEEKRQSEGVEKVGADGQVEVELPTYEPHQSKTWVYGTVIFVSGSLFNFASYAFAAQSLLASLEAIQFVTNIAFGKLLLGKKITTKMYVGTALVCVGTILTVIFSSKAQATFTATELLLLYKNPGYITYLCLIIFGGGAIHLTHLRYQKSVDDGRPLPHARLVLPITFAVFSALFGTQSVVQIKCVAALLFTLGLVGALSEPYTFLFLGVWILFVVVWLVRLNAALSKYDPMFIIPLFQVNFIFFAIVSGGIYFKEFDSFDGLQWSGFVCGSTLSFTGLSMLVPKANAAVAPEEGGDAAAQQPSETSSTQPEATRRSKVVPTHAPAPFPDDPSLRYTTDYVFAPVPGSEAEHKEDEPAPPLAPPSGELDDLRQAESRFFRPS